MFDAMIDIFDHSQTLLWNLQTIHRPASQLKLTVEIEERKEFQLEDHYVDKDLGGSRF
jgi:hypothetical protein